MPWRRNWSSWSVKDRSFLPNITPDAQATAPSYKQWQRWAGDRQTQLPQHKLQCASQPPTIAALAAAGRQPVWDTANNDCAHVVIVRSISGARAAQRCSATHHRS